MCASAKTAYGRSGPDARVEVGLDLVGTRSAAITVALGSIHCRPVLESINPALAVSDSFGNGNEAPINPFARGRGWWWGPWYEPPESSQ